MVEISLKSGEVALVDSKDFPALCVFSWYYTDGYASTKIQAYRAKHKSGETNS